MATNKNQPYLIFVLIVLGVAFLIMRSYITTLLLASVAAYLFYPVHKRLIKKIRPSISASLVVILFFAIILTFAKFGLDFILNEAIKIQALLTEETISHINDKIPTSIGGIDINIQGTIKDVLQKTVTSLTASLAAIPKLIIKLFVFVVSMFYFLKDGAQLVAWLKENMPLPKDKTAELFRDIKQKADAIIHVQLVIAIIQGTLGGIGFWIFGLPYPILSGVIMGVLSLIPWFGPYLIYAPVGIITTLEGNYFSGIGILLYGGLFVSTIDDFIKPYLASKRAKVHMLIMLIGIIGGIEVFGIAGLLIGPILLAIAIGMLQEVKVILEEEHEPKKTAEKKK